VLCGVSGGELGGFVSGCGAANVVALALEGGERGGGVVALWAGPLLCASGMFDGGLEVVAGHGGEHGVVVGAGEVLACEAGGGVEVLELLVVEGPLAGVDGLGRGEERLEAGSDWSWHGVSLVGLQVRGRCRLFRRERRTRPGRGWLCR